MWRIAQALPKLKSARLPHTLVVLDTETHVNTDNDGNVTFPFRLGVAKIIRLTSEMLVESEETYRFLSTEDFVNVLTIAARFRHTVYAFAHNIGFDIRALDLPKYIDDLGIENKPPIVNNRIFMWRIKLGRTTIKFLDTANLGVTSVGALGKSLGREKTEVDFDTVPNEELYIYCQNDVEIIEEFILAYLRLIYTNDLGTFRMTIASQSFTTYRYKFMRRQPHIHLDENALKLERDGYYGGRTECFFIGELPDENYSYVDINSLYPYVMKHGEMPYLFRGFSVNVAVPLLASRLANYYVIADVDLTTNEQRYPVRHEGRLCFPVGNIRTVLHHDNLLHALENGDIAKIHRCAVYERGVLFADYVDFFNQLKERYTEENRPAWREVVKLYMNSLYGKFGQQGYNTTYLGKIDPGYIKRVPIFTQGSEERYQLLSWYGKLYKEGRGGESIYSCPAIAGAVAAKARLVLWDMITQAGQSNVFYCDTDSLFLNRLGFANLLSYIHPTKLGLLKLDKKTTHVVIHGNKDYVFGRTIRKKGVPSKARILSPNSWEYVQFASFIAWLNAGGIGGVKGKVTIKQRRSRYLKGEVQADGSVKPLVLEMW